MKTLLRTALLIGVTATGIYTCGGSLFWVDDATSHSQWKSVTSNANPSDQTLKSKSQPDPDPSDWQSLKLQATAQVKNSAELVVKPNAPSIGATPDITVKPLSLNALLASANGGNSEAIRNLPSVTTNQPQRLAKETDSSRPVSLKPSPDSLEVSAPTPMAEKLIVLPEDQNRLGPTSIADTQSAPMRLPTPVATPVIEQTLPPEQRSVSASPVSASQLADTSPKRDPEVSFATPPAEVPRVNLKETPTLNETDLASQQPAAVPKIVDLAIVQNKVGRGEILKEQSETEAVDPVADFPVEAEVAESPFVAQQVSSSQTVPLLTAAPSAEERASKHISYGKSLARRGSVFAARQELMQALRIIAESYDIQTRSRDYTGRLARGWRALQESDDFIAMDAQQQINMNLADILDTHATQIIDRKDWERLSPIEAMQAYYAFAEAQMLQAIGKSTVGSEALFAMGKLLTTAARFDASGKPQDRTKAMVMHQVALSADSDNYLSANELGVLLANNGRWKQALELFTRSLKIEQTAATWKNMAVAHEQVSLRSQDPEERHQQAEWAELAMNEFERLSGESVRVQSAASQDWTTPEQFNDMAAMPEIEGQVQSASAPGVKTSSRKKLIQNVKDWF